MEIVLPTAVAGAAALTAAGYVAVQSLSGGASSAGAAALVNLDAFTEQDLKKAETAGRAAAGMKRAFDIFVSVALLVVASPLLILTALAVKLESPGPVLYRQVRVGEGGRLFEIVKFRSMRQDAEAGGATWAAERDPRVTRVGRIIRHLRIDEIPQAFNVLSGEMSFVGPRPERPEFVTMLEQTIPHYQIRHRVKPGITGWAQVNYKYGASIEDARKKLQFDLYYLKNYSLLMDLDIVLKTIRVAFFGIGSR